jgi:DNA polymerase III delta prime subunit
MLKKKFDGSIQCKEIKPNSGRLTIVQHKIQLKASKFLTNLLAKYVKNIDTDKINCIIKGYSGSGKTFLVKDLTKQLDIKILELNSSCNRDFKTLKNVIGTAIKHFTVIKGEINATVVFLDDIDVILDTDTLFMKGLKWILSESKCPVIMTCTNLPKEFKNTKIDVLELEKSIEYLDLLYNYRDTYNIRMTNIEILYMFRYYSGNLNYIFTSFHASATSSKNLIDCTSGKVVSSSTIVLDKVLDIFEYRWGDICYNSVHPSIALADLVLWLDFLILNDLNSIPDCIVNALCSYFYRHPAILSITIPPNIKKKPNLREAGVMGDTTDYLFYYQVLDALKKPLCK